MDHESFSGTLYLLQAVGLVVIWNTTNVRLQVHFPGTNKMI